MMLIYLTDNAAASFIHGGRDTQTHSNEVHRKQRDSDDGHQGAIECEEVL